MISVSRKTSLLNIFSLWLRVLLTKLVTLGVTSTVNWTQWFWVVVFSSWWVDKCSQRCSVVVYSGGQGWVWSDWKISHCELFSWDNYKQSFLHRSRETLIQYNQKWNLLWCVTTNDDNHMCGTEKGLVGQICKACENSV